MWIYQHDFYLLSVHIVPDQKLQSLTFANPNMAYILKWSSLITYKEYRRSTKQVA